MRLGKRLFINAFKNRMIFKADFLVGTVFSFLYIILKIYIWRGLYGDSAEGINGIILADVVAYSLVSSLTEGITKSTVMGDINSAVVSGDIVMQLLIPVNYVKYLLLNSVVNNIFRVIYSVLPSVIMAKLFFDIDIFSSPYATAFYLVSLVLGTAISFLYNFLFGLSSIWLRNSFFLDNANSVLFTLFSGSFVPLWFFPEWMSGISYLLPFRYIVYEPAAIMIGDAGVTECIRVIGVQMIWLLILAIAGVIVWKHGKRKLMIQGG